MHLLLPIVLIFALVFGPGWWVRKVMSRYSDPKDRYEGTGAQLARHLLDDNDLQGIKVEETTKGDHYDPIEKVVRLSQDNFNGRSLTAAMRSTPLIRCATLSPNCSRTASSLSLASRTAL